MAKPKRKPLYDTEMILQELLKAVAESYDETGELKMTAEELRRCADTEDLYGRLSNV